MEISLDPDSKVPPYEQIKSSIIELIAGGQMLAHHRLPPIRQLAGDLGLAPNTVARAYRELEADGFVRSRGRRGTAVLGMPSSPVAERPDATIRQAIEDARRKGYDGPTILAMVSRTLAEGRPSNA